MKALLILPALLFLNGCRDSHSGSVSPEPVKRPGGTANAAQLDPETVLVSVNGEEYTVEACDEDVRLRLDPVKKKIPPQRVLAVTSRLRARLIREFVFKTLLLQEAKRRGITATSEEERRALARIDEHLRPKGMTVEDVLASSPAGEDRLRGELTDGICMERLLEVYMTNELAVTEEDVTAYLEENRGSLAVPERVHARHILIKTSPEDTEAIREEKLKRVQRIRQEIVDGADFAALAREHSACSSSERGGDLGRFGRGHMVRPFELAAFAQKTNEVGRVIETPFGYHIVQVLEHTPPGLMSREEVRGMIWAQNRDKARSLLLRELIREADIDPPELAEKLLPR